MKLLGWMHRKFSQNIGGTIFKDLAIGCSCACLSGQLSDVKREEYPKPGYSWRALRQPQSNCNAMTSFAGLELEQANLEGDDHPYQDESSDKMTELFHGFLAIGTLDSCPPTPTFALSVENVTETETEVTDNELKLTNEELQKMIEAEAKEDGLCDSSGRKSHVSTIRLSSDQMEGEQGNEKGAMTVCPLQGYLFGSSVELPQTTSAAKKEHRTSPEELFQKSKTAELSSAPKCERDERRNKSAARLLKKMLKRPMSRTSPKSSSTAAYATHSAADESASIGTKLHKILHRFHRKIHPEISTTEKNFNKLRNGEMNGFYNNGNQRNSDEDSMTFFERPIGKESTRSFESRSSGSRPTGNGGYWIKTDAEYLILEL